MVLRSQCGRPPTASLCYICWPPTCVNSVLECEKGTDHHRIPRTWHIIVTQKIFMNSLFVLHFCELHSNISPFYWWRNWGTETFYSLPRLKESKRRQKILSHDTPWHSPGIPAYFLFIFSVCFPTPSQSALQPHKPSPSFQGHAPPHLAAFLSAVTSLFFSSSSGASFIVTPSDCSRPAQVPWIVSLYFHHHRGFMHVIVLLNGYHAHQAGYSNRNGFPACIHPIHCTLPGTW